MIFREIVKNWISPQFVKLWSSSTWVIPYHFQVELDPWSLQFLVLGRATAAFSSSSAWLAHHGPSGCLGFWGSPQKSKPTAEVVPGLSLGTLILMIQPSWKVVTILENPLVKLVQIQFGPLQLPKTCQESGFSAISSALCSAPSQVFLPRPVEIRDVHCPGLPWVSVWPWATSNSWTKLFETGGLWRTFPFFRFPKKWSNWILGCIVLVLHGFTASFLGWLMLIVGVTFFVAPQLFTLWLGSTMPGMSLSAILTHFSSLHIS